MSIDELKKVLAKIQLGDSRQVDGLVLMEWNDTIGHLGFEDTIKAVTMHRQESTAYLMPAHLIANVRRLREQRALNSGPEECPLHPGYPAPSRFGPCYACERENEWATT